MPVLWLSLPIFFLTRQFCKPGLHCNKPISWSTAVTINRFSSCQIFLRVQALRVMHTWRQTCCVWLCGCSFHLLSHNALPSFSLYVSLLLSHLQRSLTPSLTFPPFLPLLLLPLPSPTGVMENLCGWGCWRRPHVRKCENIYTRASNLSDCVRRVKNMSGEKYLRQVKPDFVPRFGDQFVCVCFFLWWLQRFLSYMESVWLRVEYVCFLIYNWDIACYKILKRDV